MGVQGRMVILEGSGSDSILLNESYVIRIEKKEPGLSEERKSGDFDLKQRVSPFEELEIQIIGYIPHVKERQLTWIKGQVGVIEGLKPFPTYQWNPQQGEIPLSGRFRLFPEPHEIWNLHALHVNDIEQAVTTAYLSGNRIQIRNADQMLIKEIPLEKALKIGLEWPGGKAAITLLLNFSPLKGFDDPQLLVTMDDLASGIQYDLQISLFGPESLLNKNRLKHSFGKAPFSIDLRRTPSINFIEDHEESVFLIAFDGYGRVFGASYRGENLNTVAVYDEGFGGYAALGHIPFSSEEGDRHEKESKILALLADELTKGEMHPEELAPPLQLLCQGSRKVQMSFAQTCMDYMEFWYKTGTWILPTALILPPHLQGVIDSINWQDIPRKDRVAAFWCARFFDEITPLLQKGSDPIAILKAKEWPLPLPSQFSNDEEFLTQITQQLFSIGELLPENSFNFTSSASALSCYFRAYGIHMKHLSPPMEQLFPNPSPITLETPITLKHEKITPLKKLEDNLPAVVLKVKEGSNEDMISLAYDPSGSTLKWPVLQGKYLLRFQPATATIPHHLRLRQARQINYANEERPYSFEGDLIIRDGLNGALIEKTLSMNNVYESPDGYRFYLASISPANESAVKRVQLIVNRDPGKYVLTYPGAAILTLGILLLFWFGKQTKLKEG